ncbi:MAG: hypothetical protein Q8S73_12985 [Deltaproteobacteria bacterium]|nr:hypothetical protein [Myxococcales bacterium]MDP3215015.1 hypothetical protein [Deltaproteobacteria bacterium]
MSPTPPRWVRLGAAPFAARFALLLLAAVGHLLFLGSLTWTVPWTFATPALLASANLTALALAAFRPTPRALTAGRALVAVVGLTTALCTAIYLAIALEAVSSGRHDRLPSVVLPVGFGLVGSLIGSTVAVPLALALDRWRREPTIRRALDAWATLASIAAVFAVVRPAGLDATVARCALQPGASAHCERLAYGHALAAADVAMAGLAVALAAALWAFERHARRWLDAARGGGLPGYRLAPIEGVDAGGAPTWALTEAPALHALVAGSTDASYRESATSVAVAVIPAAEDASWREGAMFLVLLLSAVAFLGRWLL